MSWFTRSRCASWRKFEMTQTLELLMLSHLFDSQRLVRAQRHFLTFNKEITSHDFCGAFAIRRRNLTSERIQFTGLFVVMQRRFFLLFTIFVVTIFVVVVIVVIIHHRHIGKILLIFAEEFGIGPTDLRHNQLMALLIAQHLAASGLHPLLQLVL